MGNILDLSVSLLSPLTQFLSSEVSKLRLQARVAATREISDSDIRSKLREGALSSSLFCPDSVTAVQEAIQRPAPRQIRLSKTATPASARTV